MSKSKEVSSKPSGAHSFGAKTNYVKPAHQHGPVDNGKHEKPLKSDGAHANAKKPLVHSEQVGVTHNGRLLPQETILKDSKVITSGSGHSGRLAKRNNV